LKRFYVAIYYLFFSDFKYTVGSDTWAFLMRKYMLRNVSYEYHTVRHCNIKEVIDILYIILKFTSFCLFKFVKMYVLNWRYCASEILRKV